MGILYLVRHGQANSGGLHTSDVADGAMEETYDRLTPLGHEQAAATGRSLAARIGGVGGGARSGAVQESAAGEGAARPVVLSGPPERMMPFGLNWRICSSVTSHAQSSQYTPSSRTRRATSCVY